MFFLFLRDYFYLFIFYYLFTYLFFIFIFFLLLFHFFLFKRLLKGNKYFEGIKHGYFGGWIGKVFFFIFNNLFLSFLRYIFFHVFKLPSEGL